MNLSHYTIDVGDVNIFGNFITVRILWYSKECSAPSPFTGSDEEIFVSSPNFAEKLFGVTLETKLDSAKCKSCHRGGDVQCLIK